MNALETQRTGKIAMSEINASNECAICKGELWVCENHPSVPWNNGNPPCCGGAGAPCSACNTPVDGSMPKPQPGTTIIWTAKDGYAN
jgi:hypothetical protein